MRVSFIVENLGASQTNNSLIEFVNKYTQEGHPSIVFFDTMHAHPQQMLFSTMHIVEAYNYGGTYVTTSVPSTKLALSFPCYKRILYYVWDFEWMLEQKPYQYWSEIIRHDDVEIIARTEKYGQIISKCFDKYVGHFCDDFKYDVFKEILNVD